MVDRRGLDLRHVRQLGQHFVDHLAAFLDVRHLPAAKHHRHDHLVLMGEKLAGLAHLDVNIVVARLGPDANLFDLDLMRVTLVLPLLLLILELAVVHYSADRRAFGRGHFDQV